MRLAVPALVALCVVSCSAAPSVETTTTTPATTTTTVPTATTTAFVPLVPSPFTDKEIDFINAVIVMMPDWIGADPETVVHHDGVDLDGDGIVDEGWHNLDVVGDYSTTVFLASEYCSLGARSDLLESVARFEKEYDTVSLDETMDFFVIVDAWLC